MKLIQCDRCERDLTEQYDETSPLNEEYNFTHTVMAVPINRVKTEYHLCRTCNEQVLAYLRGGDG